MHQTPSGLNGEERTYKSYGIVLKLSTHIYFMYLVLYYMTT